MNIGIIGSAGRGSDSAKLDQEKWEQMRAATQSVIDSLIFNISGFDGNLTLVSGGAGWADHIAVSLYYRQYANNLLLHLPCKFSLELGYFEGDQTAKTANYYHLKFSEKVSAYEWKSLRQIGEVIRKGAEITVSNGFFERNSLVARDSDYLIALTFGEKDLLKDGGTMDTMRKFIKQKGDKNSFHIDLNTMEIYSPARVL